MIRSTSCHRRSTERMRLKSVLVRITGLAVLLILVVPASGSAALAKAPEAAYKSKFHTIVVNPPNISDNKSQNRLTTDQGKPGVQQLPNFKEEELTLALI